jgi:hypothetical protein
VLPESTAKEIKTEVFKQLGWISPVVEPPSDYEVAEHLGQVESETEDDE